MAGERGLEPYQTLLSLVSQYSPSGSEAGVVETLVARMEALGYDHAGVDAAGNAVGVLGSGERQLVLLGHIDTVPGEIEVRVEGDLLFGRGTVDAKGSLAAFVDAVASVGRVEGWQFVVIGGVDEERSSRGARFVAGEYQPKFAVIGEPSGWDRVTLGYKGYAGAEVTVRRPAAHDSGIEDKPCEILFDLWKAISAQAAEANEGVRRLI